MNIAKNMEAIFVVAVVLAGVTTYASAAPVAQAAPKARISAPLVDASIPTVHVIGKRPRAV